mmetsp:Transcript_80336/g.260351  ORF Transcript_80336/g.260351 Transcript_80336/m.260351 type:complete len:686 (-) Transcript_80336:486-2543(-)
MWLRWKVGQVPGLDEGARPVLRIGDILAGGSEWLCGAEDNKSALGFVREIVGVESNATADARVTVVRTRPTTLFHVAQDLYIDYSWTVAETSPHGAGRTLTDYDYLQSYDKFNYNYDPATSKAKETFPMGPLECSNCFAYMGVTVTLHLETSGVVPSAFSLKIVPLLNVSVELGVPLTPEHLSIGWKKMASMAFGQWDPFTALDATMAMPLFFSGLNQASLNLMVPLRGELYGQLEADSISDLLADDKFVFHASTPNTFVEVGWKSGVGFWSDMAFELNHEVKLPDIGRGLREVRPGLKPCFSLYLTVGKTAEELSNLEICAELTMSVSQSLAPTSMQAPRSMQQTSMVPDAILCIGFDKFETDTDGDKLDLDLFPTPYVEACFFGTCLTSKKTAGFEAIADDSTCTCFGSCSYWGGSYEWCFSVNAACPGWQATCRNRVSWAPDYKCMPIQRSQLDQSNFSLRVQEADVLFDDSYTDPLSFLLPKLCGTTSGCSLNPDLDLLGTYKTWGTYAQLHVQISVRDIDHNRRMDGNSASPEGMCSGSSVAFQLGSTSAFGGFKYPSFFSTGSSQHIVDPVQGPPLRPRTAELLCYPAPTTTPTTSTTTPTTSPTTTQTTTTTPTPTSDPAPQTPEPTGSQELNSDPARRSSAGVASSTTRAAIPLPTRTGIVAFGLVSLAMLFCRRTA